MTDLQQRIEALPASLRDGSWTQCLIRVRGQRVLLSELPPHTRHRRRNRLRRRLWRALAAAAAVLAIPWLGDATAQVVAGVVASLLVLALLDGLRQELVHGPRPIEFAIYDAAQAEVRLLRPDGTGLCLPLGEIEMFLLLVEPRQRQYHVGVVMHGGVFLSWLHTPAGYAAGSLAWLLGYLTDRPARHVVAAVPPPLEAVRAASPIEPPPAG